MSVLRILPNLQKLDDKTVSQEEVQIAVCCGKVLSHPLYYEASSPQADQPTEVNYFYSFQFKEENFSFLK